MWHPATDNGLGTESYGIVKPDATGGDTFSVKYDGFAWNKIMFARGDLSKWLIIEKTVWSDFVN